MSISRFGPKSLLVALPLLVPAASFAVAADALVMQQNNQTGTRDCAGGDARIDGNSNTLTLRNCTKVTVAGNSNEINAGTAAALSLLGNDNHVSWGGQRPRISDVGSRNVVVRAGTAGGKAAADSAGHADAGAARVKVGTDDVAVDAGGARVTVGPGGVSVNNGGGTVDVDAGGVSVGGAGAQIAVTLNGQHRTYDCKGGGASVSGDRNVLTLRNCTTVNVSGDENEIHSGTASRINLVGNRNRVRHAADASPRVSDQGSDNSVTPEP